MAEKVEVDIEINSNLEPTIANLKKLKLQLRETAAGSAEFNKIASQIRDLDDAIKDYILPVVDIPHDYTGDDNNNIVRNIYISE